MDPFAIGLSIVRDFVTPEEEAEIVSHITKKQETKKGKERNSIQRFGSRKPYAGNMVSNTIPDYLNAVADKLVAAGLIAKRVDSVSINEYHVGQLITPHIDSRSSGDVITILSLLGSARMVFSQAKKESVFVDFPPRAVLQMRDEIRHKWKHGIEPVTELRYSLVFRQSQ